MMYFIDTHCHLDGEEFAEDRDAVVARAREAGVAHVLIPAIDPDHLDDVLRTCRRYPGYCHPMVGLHPEEVRDDWREQLARLRSAMAAPSPDGSIPPSQSPSFIAIGEVGLDFYWSREFEQQQLDAFEKQVRWSVETRLPLMIHCRKAQNEMVTILKRYREQLPGGVFHCFTGNTIEAAELLQFSGFVLGVGGVLTFKKSHLPEVLPEAVPLERLVMETDAPYMAPVPVRGQRNEPAFTRHVLRKLAECYGVPEEEIAAATNANVARVLQVKL